MTSTSHPNFPVLLQAKAAATKFQACSLLNYGGFGGHVLYDVKIVKPKMERYIHYLKPSFFGLFSGAIPKKGTAGVAPFALGAERNIDGSVQRDSEGVFDDGLCFPGAIPYPLKTKNKPPVKSETVWRDLMHANSAAGNAVGSSNFVGRGRRVGIGISLLGFLRGALRD